MRIFVIMASHDKVDQDRPDISLEVYQAESVLNVCNHINDKYGEVIYWPCIAPQLSQEEQEKGLLEWIAESNGDGDWYFMIGEIVDGCLRLLLE